MLRTAAAAWKNLQGKSFAGTMDILNLILIYTFSPSPMIKQSMFISPFADISKKRRFYRPYSNHIICMLATAAAVWENLQGKSCAGTIIILNLILIYTFSPSPMIKKQSMVISPFADICKKQGPTDHIQITY
jgi:hypothetical protein